MKKIILLLMLPLFASAQQSKFFIRFTDKNGSSYSISNPSAFLSARSIQRRTNQSIAVTEQDIPVNQSYIDGVVALGATVFTRSKWFNGITIQCDSSILNSILALPYVQNFNRVLKTGGSRHPKKPETILPVSHRIQYPDETNSLDYGGSFNQIHLMHGEFLHDQGDLGEGKVIALLDAGFNGVDVNPDFDTLRNASHILGTWDFVANESSVYEDDTHGMEVLSTIAGNVPGQLVGTAPHVSVWLLRTEDTGSENLIEEYNWEAGAEYADSVGADLISSSLGYTQFDDTTLSHTYADMNGHTCPASIAANIATEKGILVLVSAGNSGDSPWHNIGSPADADSALAVGAVDSSGNFIFFSSYGPSSDGDVKPNVAAKGFETSIGVPGGGVTQGNGTSFACPVLAGSAACLWQAHPEKTNMEIYNAIEESANYFTTPTDTMGYGIPNFQIADFLLSTPVIEFQNKDQLLGVYPNPVNDFVSVRYYSSKFETLNIEIVNVIGEKILEKNEIVSPGNISNINIKLPDLSSGIYLLHLIGETSDYSVKLVR